MKIKGKLIFLKGTNETKKCSEKKKYYQFPFKIYPFIIGSTFSIIIESIFKELQVNMVGRIFFFFFLVINYNIQVFIT